jgi:hypothetical protein
MPGRKEPGLRDARDAQVRHTPVVAQTTTRSLGGRYRLIEPLGTGGMSVVWRAHDEVLDRPVAVKLLASRFAGDTAFRERLRAEAQAAARLAHPNITSVYDYGESVSLSGTPVPYVVMELLDGTPLSARLAAGALPWRTAAEICAEIASALSAAHVRGLVHRDVTPDNVMLTPAGAKVLDFGISALIGESGRDGPGGAVIGTPAYLAPERLAGEPVGPAADVYALGLLLYQTLTGHLPWGAETTAQMAAGHRYSSPDPLPPIPDAPADLAILCGQCLDQEPRRRPSSAYLARWLSSIAGVRMPAADAETTEAALPPPGPPRVGVSERATSGTRILPPAALRLPERGQPAAEAEAAEAPSTGWFATRRSALWAVAAGMVALGVLVGVGTVVLLLSTEDRKGVVAAGAGSASPVSSAPAATVPPGGCTASAKTQTESDNATNLTVTVTNTGQTDLTGWTLTFTLPGEQRVLQGSAGEWSQSGDQVTVRSPDSGATLAAGASVTVGASLSRRGKRNAAPSRFALNGVRCGGRGEGGGRG